MTSPNDGRAWLDDDTAGTARTRADTDDPPPNANDPQPLPASNPIATKAANYARLSGRKSRYLQSPGQTKRRFKAGAQIVREGDAGGLAFAIHQGWTYTSATHRDGNRQVCDIQIPGDVANLQGLVLPCALHDLTAITDVEAFEIRFTPDTGTGAPDPDDSAVMLWLFANQAAVMATRLANLGRRTAIARTAHLYLELWIRLRMAGLGTDAGYRCPMTQYLIADLLGLTPVHVNRVLRELRTQGCASHQRGWFSLLDKDRLAALAGFDGAYLDTATTGAS
jgi:CRP-like cAMP-binding protein